MPNAKKKAIRRPAYWPHGQRGAGCQAPSTLCHTCLAHDGFGFHTNFACNLVGITLLEFWQEEFDRERAGVSFFQELAQNSSQRLIPSPGIMRVERSSNSRGMSGTS
jgi:hypothetical protein